MRKAYLYGTIICMMMGCQSQPITIDAEKELEYCSSQVCKALEALQDSTGNYNFTMMPRNICPTPAQEGKEMPHAWNLRQASNVEWCSGFWPGILWMTYEYEAAKANQSKEHACVSPDSLKSLAVRYTEALVPVVEAPVYDHDLGFITINSFLKGYEATGCKHYRQVALRAADSLATLYNPITGTLLSWPRHVKDYGGHNTIMDNMMNLELLFWANQTSDASEGVDRKHLYDIAVKHAETTMQHQFREDGGCYHVAVYDTLDGHFIKGQTHQGYADSSMWSRGQSWAIYGYTMVYRYTHDPRFLDFARKVTDIYLQRLRETSDDRVPYWDMDAVAAGGAVVKDASAACVVASALLELCQYATDGDSFIAGGKPVNRIYYEAALAMLRDLSTERYQSRDRNTAFLLHSTGHHPAGSEIDASIIYADYYYIEALLRLRQYEN